MCEKFGASGLDLKDEVLPLAAYGLFSGGEFEGLHVVTNEMEEVRAIPMQLIFA